MKLIVTNVINMKFIKSYKLFESHYNFEEFVDVVCRELSNYNIRPIQVRHLISKYKDSINQGFQNGESPQFFAKQLIDELDLDGNKDSMMVNFNQPKIPEIKYL